MTPQHDSHLTFSVTPDSYHHWIVSFAPPVATLTLSVNPDGGLRNDYQLKLNSYDLGVDIELHDIVNRLRFERPDIKAVVITGGLDNVFCSGANIQMLAGSSHHHKVNFCKFTNETRNTIEEATEFSQLPFLAAVNGTAAGGGYELALACDEIVLVDDKSAAVSLPEVPLLAVLPGTGGLTRVVDKRFVRRDLADVFSTKAEGVKAQQALEWGLVDAITTKSEFHTTIAERAHTRAATSDRPGAGPGLPLTPIARTGTADGVDYEYVSVGINRSIRTAEITLKAPTTPQPATGQELLVTGDSAWLVAAARQLDDAILHLRFNETEIGTWVLKTEGDPTNVLAAEALLDQSDTHWLVREVSLLWRRTLKRVELSARTIFALIEPGSCFVSTLAELFLLADRTYMLEGTWEDSDVAPPTVQLTEHNAGRYPMANGLTRLETRFWGRPKALETARSAMSIELDAAGAVEAELVTEAMDDIDWEDEIRVMLEERASFSPDALTGMEANYRFVGPETMETKIFARLSAWQNWIFQRPNAVGESGALQRFGTGTRPAYDQRRV